MLASLALAVSTLVPSALAAPSRPTGPLAPESGALLGAWPKPRDGSYSRASQQARWETLETAAGRTLDIGHAFYPWDSPFPTWREGWHLESGRIPLISWNGTFTSEIAAGEHDALVTTRADAVKALDGPVFLRWFWEMDGRKKADWAESPDQFVSAWRRIHGIFDARGAHNVVWVWCPNASAFTRGEAAQWYPGDDVVDWVCADGYSWAPGRPGDQWRSLPQIFAGFHEWGLRQDKPMMIGETGVQERAPGEKPDWLRAIPSQLATELPGIAAIVYFDSNRDYTWWLDTTPESLSAFAATAAHPYLNPRSTGGGSPPPEAASGRVTRLAGGDRLATAVAISRATYADGAAHAVVLARADGFADALAGAPLARAADAPLLLSASTALPAAVLAEIERVLPPGGSVHLLGGPAALGPAVAERLHEAGFRTIRHGGRTRYATAVAIARAADPPQVVLLATGTDFPDALAAAAAAANLGGVTLLTDGTRLPPEVATFLAEHPAVPRYTIGHPAAAAAPSAIAVTGADRYDTAVQTALKFFPSATVLGVANGTTFPDALAAGVHIADEGGPLLLTPPDTLPDVVERYVNDLDQPPAAAYLYGGLRAAGRGVEASLAGLLAPA